MPPLSDPLCVSEGDTRPSKEILFDEVPSGTSSGRSENARACAEKIIARLEAEGAEDLAAPMRLCGEGFALICTSCGKRHEGQRRCKKRWCPVCSRIISAKRIDKYQSAIDTMQSPVFVTLTMQHSAISSSPEDVRVLRRALGRFRNRTWFRRRVAGGIASIEVTCGPNGWHPHCHLLMDCRWFSVSTPAPSSRYNAEQRAEMMRASQAETQWQWESCLPDGVRGGLFVSRAREGVAREVLKYAVKPADLVAAAWPLAPMLRTLAVSRLISTWGSVRQAAIAIASLESEEQSAGMKCQCGASDWTPEMCTPYHEQSRATSAVQAYRTKIAKEYAVVHREMRVAANKMAR